MRVLILGDRGQLGTALRNIFEKKKVPHTGVDLPDFDITNKQNVLGTIDRTKPDIIINSSAYTDVKAADHEFKKAIMINVIGLKALSEKCNQENIYLCHISTDYVFDGTKNKPYIEEDITNPINCYGLSKEMGEKIIKNYCENYVIVRTAALYGSSRLKSENIVDKIIHFAKLNNEISLVVDEFTTPTFTEDLADQIYVILRNKLEGIIHATCQGECNWYKFGEYIFQTLNMNVEIKKVNSNNFSKTLRKPLYSVLENARLKSLELNIMPDWKISLQRYLKENYQNQ